MKNTLRALALAVPMAASIGVAGVAFADTPQVEPTNDLVLAAGAIGPQFEGDIELPPNPGDPEPNPPHGPDDKDGPNPDDPGPHGPGDLDGPKPDGGPDGPGDLDGPKPGDHDDDDGDHDDDDGDHDDDDGDDNDKRGHSVRKPSRIDAGDADQGSGLSLILAGGAVIATGGAFAARRMARN